MWRCAAAPITGKIVWQQTVENRTLAAGEIAVKANEPIVLKLRFPRSKQASPFEAN